MARRADLLHEILSLPVHERRELARALLQSLAREGQVADLSLEEEAELASRMEAADAGEVVPAAEVLRQLDARRSPR